MPRIERPSVEDTDLIELNLHRQHLLRPFLTTWPLSLTTTLNEIYENWPKRWKNGWAVFRRGFRRPAAWVGASPGK